MARLTRNEAIEIAKAECSERGWPWTEPVRVGGWLWSYAVMTNAGMRGGNVNVRIRIRDGKVIRSGYAPR